MKPQITPDGKITLTLDVNKDTPLPWSPRALVTIDTKHVKTGSGRKWRNSGDRWHLHSRTSKTTRTRFRSFGDLPYVGWLFKTMKIDDKTELLVFITPRIVSENLKSELTRDSWGKGRPALPAFSIR